MAVNPLLTLKTPETQLGHSGPLTGIVVDIKNDAPVDGIPKFRAKVRPHVMMDQARVPDKNLPWVDVIVPTTSHGGTPFLLPGMIVGLSPKPGAPGAGLEHMVIENVLYKPDAQHAETGKPGKPTVPDQSQVAQPRQTGQYPFNYQTDAKDPRKVTTTTQAGPNNDKNTVQQTATTPYEQSRNSRKNRFDETDSPKADEDNLGSKKNDKQKDAQQALANIGNPGAIIPSAVAMLQQLKKLGPGMNPTAINSVGLGNFMSALSALEGIFGNTNNSNKKKPLDCSIDNRINLTPEELQECLYRDSLAVSALNTSNTSATT